MSIDTLISAADVEFALIDIWGLALLGVVRLSQLDST